MTADVKYGGGGHVAGVAAGGAGGGTGVQFDMQAVLFPADVGTLSAGNTGI